MRVAGSASLARMATMIESAGFSPAALGGVAAASGEGALAFSGVVGSGSAPGVAAAVLVRGSVALSGCAGLCEADAAPQAQLGASRSRRWKAPPRRARSSSPPAAPARAQQRQSRQLRIVRPSNPRSRHTLASGCAKGHPEFDACTVSVTPHPSEIAQIFRS